MGKSSSLAVAAALLLLAATYACVKRYTVVQQNVVIFARIDHWTGEVVVIDRMDKGWQGVRLAGSPPKMNLVPYEREVIVYPDAARNPEATPKVESVR